MASPAKTDLDFDLKLRTAAALSASGYSCRLNVLLSAVGDAGLADVTDVDVLAISRDLTFTPRVVCVSAKAGTSLVVAKELFYLRGVLSYMRGDEGVLLLGGRDVPPHLRELASSLSLLLLVKGEIDVWRSALVNGIHDPGYFSEPLFLEYEKAMNALPPSSSIKAFLSADYWFHRDFRNVQNLIAHLKKYAHILDGRGKLHPTQYLDIAWHFSQTLLDLCLHVQRGGVERLGETVSTYMFGGRTSYKARRDLLANVAQVLVATGVAKADSIPSLDPSYTHALAELVTRYLERPHAAIAVPLVLQDSLWRGLGARGMEPPSTKNQFAAFKLAQDLIDFLRTASDGAWAPSLL